MRASAFFLVSTLVATSVLSLGSGCKLGYDFGSNTTGAGAGQGQGGAELIGCGVCGNGVCESPAEDDESCPEDCGGGGGAGGGGEGGYEQGGAGGAGGWEQGGAGGVGGTSGEGGAEMGALCGDGVCDTNFEDAATCPADCGS